MGYTSQYNLGGCCYSHVKTVVSQIGEIGFFNDVGLCPKVEKEYKRKVKMLIFATKPLITFFWVLFAGFTYEVVLCGCFGSIFMEGGECLLLNLPLQTNNKEDH